MDGQHNGMPLMCHVEECPADAERRRRIKTRCRFVRHEIHWVVQQLRSERQSPTLTSRNAAPAVPTTGRANLGVCKALKAHQCNDFLHAGDNLAAVQLGHT